MSATLDYFNLTKGLALGCQHGRRTMRQTVVLMDAASAVVTVCSHVMHPRIEEYCWARRMTLLREKTGLEASLETVVKVLKLWNRHCPTLPDVAAVERFLWALDNL